MKYQVRIRDIMSDAPASGMLSSLKEARAELEKVREEIRTTWKTPDESAAYIAATCNGVLVAEYREGVA